MRDQTIPVLRASPTGIARRAAPLKNSAITRSKLLKAAQSLFGSQEYSNVGIRDIGALAHVDFSLIKRYFGSKRELFFASLPPSSNLVSWIDGDAETSANQLVVRVFSKGASPPDALIMLLLAAGDTEIGSECFGLLNYELIAPLAKRLSGRHRRERAAAITSLIWAALINQRCVPLKSITGHADPWLKKCLVESIQRLIEPV